MMRWQSFGRLMLDMFAPAFGFVTLTWVLYNIETRFFPVVTDFEIQAVSKDNKGHYILAGVLDKERSCELLNLSVYKLDGDKPMELLVQFQKNILGADAGVGIQHWGPIPVSLPDILKVEDDIEIIALHRCHALWLQESPYARVRYGDLMALIKTQ